MSRWTAPLELQIRLPSLRTIVFFLVMLLTVGTVVTVAVIEVLAHPGPTRPAAMDDTKVTAWISAIFTAVGSIGTAGALWLGAVTFRRQVKDQHRAQAAAVSLVTQEAERTGVIRMTVRNDSKLPISDVYLQALNQAGKDAGHEMKQVLAPGEALPLERPRRSIDRIWVKFDDSSGVRWVRYVNGELEEVKKAQPVRTES